MILDSTVIDCNCCIFIINLSSSRKIIWQLLDSNKLTNGQNHLPLRELNPGLLGERQVSYPLDQHILLCY